jgi:hypothetical protein
MTDYAYYPPQPEDIWQERDPRFTRLVRVESVGTGRRSVAIRTVLLRDDGNYTDAPNSRLSYADIERFKGRSTGYKLYSRSPHTSGADRG